MFKYESSLQPDVTRCMVRCRRFRGFDALPGASKLASRFLRAICRAHSHSYCKIVDKNSGRNLFIFAPRTNNSITFYSEFFTWLSRFLFL